MDRRQDSMRGGSGGRARRVGRLRSQGSRGTTLSIDEWGSSSATQEESVHPRDMLNARMEELEGQLKQVEERHLQLERETQEARARAEAEECEEVVGVARRNVEGVVQEILASQKERVELARLLDAEDAEVRREEEEKNRLLKAEVGRLTRNVILLQTRLLILEEKRFERDKLFGEVCQAEEKMATESKQQEMAMEVAHKESREKYKKLHSVLCEQMRSVSDCAGRVGCAQQVSALRERGLQILETQGRLRRVERLMLGLHRQNEAVRDGIRTLKGELESAVVLRDRLVEDASKAMQDLRTIIEFHDADDVSDPLEELQAKFKSLILELETKVFERNDQRLQLKEILADQEFHQRMLEEEEKSRRSTRERLLNMSKVAKLVMGDNDSVQKQEHETLSERPAFLSEMSTILLETTTGTEDNDELRPQSEVSPDGAPYTKGFLGLVPEKNPASRSKSHSPSSYTQ